MPSRRLLRGPGGSGNENDRVTHIFIQLFYLFIYLLVILMEECRINFQNLQHAEIYCVLMLDVCFIGLCILMLIVQKCSLHIIACNIGFKAA